MPEEDQDIALADFCLDLHDEGQTLQAGRDALSALQKLWPRRRWTAAWQVVRGWSQLVPPKRAPPLPEEVAMALVTLFMAAGRPACSLASLLAFCGLLRIGEALNIRRRDIVLGDRLVVLLLPTTKTGAHQRVCLGNPEVVTFLRRALLMIPGANEDIICAISYTTFRKWLTRALAVLGCSSFEFRSHSFRRGGATALFARGLPLSSIMIHGRWASETSCRLYVQAGEAALIAIRRTIAPASRQRVATLAKIGSRIFDLVADIPTGSMGSVEVSKKA